MRRARAHYVHVVCTSGHPLWQCSQQPIIYSTLISTHVNPHQSSHARGYCCGSHTARWQDLPRKSAKILLGLTRTCHHTRLVLRKGLEPALPFKTDHAAPKEKGQQAGSWLATRLRLLTGPRNTPAATCLSCTSKPNSDQEQKLVP